MDVFWVEGGRGVAVVRIALSSALEFDPPQTSKFLSQDPDSATSGQDERTVLGL